MNKAECLKIIAHLDKALAEQKLEEGPFCGNYPMITFGIPEFQYRDMAETIIRLLDERDAYWVGIERAAADHISETARIMLDGEGTEKPKGFLS